MPSGIDTASIAAERKRYFTPRWFLDLLAARLSLGDTFWIGGFGTALVFAPFGFTLFLVAHWVLSPGQFRILMGGWITFLTLFHAALWTAIVRTAWRTPQVGGWRWVGVLVALFNVAAMATMTYLFWTGAIALVPGLLR